MATVESPPKINALTSVADGIIKAAINGGDLAVETYLTVQFPFLANPVCHYILDQIVSTIGQVVYENLANITNRVIIDAQVNGEQSAVVRASQALQAANKSGDLNAIAKAKEDLIAAYAALIHSDGATHI